jgi:hypothetical protein
MFSRIASLALLTFALAASVAAAKDVKVGSVSLSLTPPSEFCDLDERQAIDSRIIIQTENTVAAGGNRLLAISADCNQLAELRAAKRKLLDDYAQYQVLAALLHPDAPKVTADFIKEACRDMRAEGEKTAAALRTDEVLKSMKLNDFRFLGVLHEEPMVCYGGILQKFPTEISTEKTQISIFGLIALKDTMIYYYSYARYEDPNSVSKLLATHKRNVAAFLEANK